MAQPVADSGAATVSRRPGAARAPQPVGPPAPPWWRIGMVWLVISGPAAVVVAGFATLYIALDGADPVLRVDNGATARGVPALLGRNHAATGGLRESRP